jgi:hypothetical protein
MDLFKRADGFLRHYDQVTRDLGKASRDTARTWGDLGSFGHQADRTRYDNEAAAARAEARANRADTNVILSGRQYDAVRNGAEPRYNPYGFRVNPQQTLPYQRPGTVYPAGLPASPEANDLAVITDVVKDLQLMNNSAGASPEVLVVAAAEIKDKLAGLTHGKSAIRIDDDMVVPIGGNINITIPARFYSPETLAQALEGQIGVDPKVKAALDAQFAQKAAVPAKGEPAPAAAPAPTSQQSAAPSPTAYHIEGLPAASGHPAKLYAGKDGTKVDPQEAPAIDQAQVAKIQEMLGAPVKVDGKWGPETQAKFAAKCKEAGVNPHAVDFTSPNDKELIALMGKLKPEMLVADNGSRLLEGEEKVVMSAPPAQAGAALSVTSPSPAATDLGLAQHGVTTPAAPLTGVAATPVAGEAPPSFLTTLGINGVTPDRQGNVTLPSSPSSVEVVDSSGAQPRRGGIDAEGHMYGGAVSPLSGSGIAHADATLSGFPSYVIDGVTVQARGFNPAEAAVPSSPAPDTAALDARVGQYAKEVGLVANTGGGNALFTAAAPAFADTASQAQALAASVSAPAVAASAVVVARGVEAAAPEALAYFEPPPPQGLPNLKGGASREGGIV